MLALCVKLPPWPRRQSLPLLFTVMAGYYFEQITAQAPVNDVISWPSGMLLLASVLYAALGSTPQRLWEIEPAIGWFLFAGLPFFSIPTMRRVNWVANACHFVPRIRTAYGKSDFWVRSDKISATTKKEALDKVTKVIHCAVYKDRPNEQPALDENLWTRLDTGLIQPKPMGSSPVTAPQKPLSDVVTSRDFLLFSAIEYHAFHSWEVEIHSSGSLLHSTKGKPPNAIVDVDGENSAIAVVAAQMVRRPHSQSPLRGLAMENDQGVFVLSLDKLDLDSPACYIDFHSYAPESKKVTASLRELARSYYLVVQHIKQNALSWSAESPSPKALAYINVGQSLWIAILAGESFNKGRLTIQNLPGRRGCKGVSADEAHLTRLDAILKILQPYANTDSFFDLVYSNGLSRRTAIPFLIAGAVGHVIICYFLSVGTTAGVWTSVALANALYAGRLNDIHSMWFGKTPDSAEPGFKMYVPGTKDLMCIATLDRTPPRQGELRQGFLLNLLGLIAAILGSVFETPTRQALGFEPSEPSQPWVTYTSIVLCIGTSTLVASTIIIQQLHEKTWADDSEIPTRWMILSTLPVSLIISGLALFFQIQNLQKLWPILDALTWLSGLPLGMLENGRIISVDDNVLHMVLLNRWMMGAVASSVGSAVSSRQNPSFF